MEHEMNGHEGFPEDGEDNLAIKHHDREFREDVGEREYQLHKLEFEFQQAQTAAQKVASSWQRASTVFLGICSLLVALVLGVAQIQMQIFQNQLAVSQSKTQEEVARIGLNTASYQAQADLLLALGKDDGRPRQAARALAQFGEQAVPPLILILLKEEDTEILEATEEAFVSIHEYRSHKGNGSPQQGEDEKLTGYPKFLTSTLLTDGFGKFDSGLAEAWKFERANGGPKQLRMKLVKKGVTSFGDRPLDAECVKETVSANGQIRENWKSLGVRGIEEGSAGEVVFILDDSVNELYFHFLLTDPKTAIDCGMNASG